MRLKIRILLLFILISIGFIGLIFVSRGASVEKTMMGTLARPFYTLTVTGSGTGTGTVVSNVYGVNCTSTAGVESGTCSVLILSGTTVILTATAIPGNSFDGWTGSGCSGTGTCTIVIDGNKTVDASFGSIPLVGLWAWFKHNEGVGATIIDYSGSGAGNGAINVVGNGTAIPNFWSIPGFAHNQTAGGGLKWMQRVSALRDFTSVSLVGFVKPLAAPSSDLGFVGAQMIGSGGGAPHNWLRYGWNSIAPFRWGFGGGSLNAVYSATYSPIFGQWYFVYCFSSPGVGGTAPPTMFVRASGGILTDVVNKPYDSNTHGTSTSLFGLGLNNINYPMDAGDMFYYATNVPSGAVLTNSQLNSIYNSLKARYGML